MTTGEDKPNEFCGLFGVWGVPNAARMIYNGLFALQHRGQEGAGIVTTDGGIHSHKGMGLLTDVFDDAKIDALPGAAGIGHVRYSTTGSSRTVNVQPLVCECADGIWAIGHNGNLTNANRLRRSYQESGAIFQTSTDTEVLMHIIADPEYRSRMRRVGRALSELEGAFAFLLMTKDSLMAARDRHGFRPLVLGRLGKGYVFASETCALEQVGATFAREILPGELVTVDAKGVRSSAFCDPAHQLGQCIFEHIYFARPDSVVFGQCVMDSRMRLGRRLAEEHPVPADIVVPVPDSGNAAALGYAQASGIPLTYGFVRNHYVGRTFIMPHMANRIDSVDMKLAIVASLVKGKRVVVVDDSIIRGTTCRRRIGALRRAGAKEIHMRVSCPPTIHPCYFGIDFPSHEELVAAHRTPEEVCKYIGADSLGYISIEGMLSVFDRPLDYCAGCFSGKYPLATEQHNKLELEKSC